MLITTLLIVFSFTAILTQVLRKDLHPLLDPLSAYLTPVLPLGWILDIGFAALALGMWKMALLLYGGMATLLMGAALAVGAVMISAVARSLISTADTSIRNILEHTHLISAAFAFLLSAMFMLNYAFISHIFLLEILAVALPLMAIGMYLEKPNKSAISEKLAVIIILIYFFQISMNK